MGTVESRSYIIRAYFLTCTW